AGEPTVSVLPTNSHPRRGSSSSHNPKGAFSVANHSGRSPPRAAAVDADATCGGRDADDATLRGLAVCAGGFTGEGAMACEAAEALDGSKAFVRRRTQPQATDSGPRTCRNVLRVVHEPKTEGIY